MHRYVAALLLAGVVLSGSARAQAPGNLLRNAAFQDDWLTLLPENRNHHWCYADGFYNRRDFNPDAWACKGSWEWLNADAPPGQRRLVLKGPSAEVAQSINWIAVHDDRSKSGFPDAGGFPTIKPQRSLQPLSVVRDVTFRVRLKGQDVPADAVAVEVSLGGDDPVMGPVGTATASATAKVPSGTFDWQWVEVKLPAAEWQKAAQAAAAKNPQEAAEAAKSGPLLPVSARVDLRYKGTAGQVEVERAELLAAEPSSPNLLPNGNFEDAGRDGYPTAWGKQEKYRYFPPGHYYIFNTWHNSRFENRGPVAGDTLVARNGGRSLKMIVAAGDEKSVSSEPVVLNQKEPRLIEVSAWVKTDRLAMLQIDAVNEKGERLDGFDFIHKAPVSVGTDEWRLVRQVFRPRSPVQSVKLMLCARGVNGYTLDDTGTQPQNNVVGTVWWDDVSLREPESTQAELTARGVKVPAAPAAPFRYHLSRLDLGERLLGDNELTATLNGAAAVKGGSLRWEVTSPSGQKSTFNSGPAVVTGDEVRFVVPYTLTELCREAYSEYRGTLTLLDGQGQPAGSSELWFGTWTTPINLELGALYLQPEQRQLVRMNLGLSSPALAKLAAVRLEVVRRGTGQVLKGWDVAATPAAVAAQRGKIPADLRGDFASLLLTDLDVSFLPVQPFNDPQRNWFVRATALGVDGKPVATVESQPFCRLAHDAPQPGVQKVNIKDGLLFVNDKPWMPWGAVYGHVPVYDGPADPGAGKYRDLHNLPAWSIYDRFTAEPYTRKRNDFNCLRYVAGSLSDPKVIEKRWAEDNVYCSSAFASPQPAWSSADLDKLAGGKDKLDAYLDFCKSSPAVVSVAPGIEEAFGLFHDATPEQLAGLEQVVARLRQATGKPVMVGHGGYWNRFEFEKVPFFDVYDPETEPFFPANLHTDLRPLVEGKDKVVWLRPQMYEDVPYERWRFHAFVELMRGCRGWQIAHGPGDQTLFRGLHGELEYLKATAYSRDAGPDVTVEPWLEHWSRKSDGKLTIIAATTHGLTLGASRWGDDTKGPAGRPRLTGSPDELRHEANAYSVDRNPEAGPSIHGIQNLPDARSWPAGTKLVQWVRLDAKETPANLVVLLKADGRWTHAASWGKFDAAPLRNDKKLAYWFLHSFYRHASGFLGWDDSRVGLAKGYIPAEAIDLGGLPAAGEWVKLELPLEKVGAADKLLDGVGFLHEGGQVSWGRTSLVGPGGETVVWGDQVGLAPEQLRQVAIKVAGLKAGTKVRVLFEDRELTAADGQFTDDFRGQDLYQRFGGGPGAGYGDTPVALHIYELMSP